MVGFNIIAGLAQATIAAMRAAEKKQTNDEFIKVLDQQLTDLHNASEDPNNPDVLRDVQELKKLKRQLTKVRNKKGWQHNIRNFMDSAQRKDMLLVKSQHLAAIERKKMTQKIDQLQEVVAQFMESQTAQNIEQRQFATLVGQVLQQVATSIQQDTATPDQQLPPDAPALATHTHHNHSLSDPNIPSQSQPYEPPPPFFHHHYAPQPPRGHGLPPATSAPIPPPTPRSRHSSSPPPAHYPREHSPSSPNTINTNELNLDDLATTDSDSNNKDSDPSTDWSDSGSEGISDSNTGTAAARNTHFTNPTSSWHHPSHTHTQHPPTSPSRNPKPIPSAPPMDPLPYLLSTHSSNPSTASSTSSSNPTSYPRSTGRSARPSTTPSTSFTSRHNPSPIPSNPLSTTHSPRPSTTPSTSTSHHTHGPTPSHPFCRPSTSHTGSSTTTTTTTTTGSSIASTTHSNPSSDPSPQSQSSLRWPQTQPPTATPSTFALPTSATLPPNMPLRAGNSERDPRAHPPPHPTGISHSWSTPCTSAAGTLEGGSRKAFDRMLAALSKATHPEYFNRAFGEAVRLVAYSEVRSHLALEYTCDIGPSCQEGYCRLFPSFYNAATHTMARAGFPSLKAGLLCLLQAFEAALSRNHVVPQACGRAPTGTAVLRGNAAVSLVATCLLESDSLMPLTYRYRGDGGVLRLEDLVKATAEGCLTSRDAVAFPRFLRMMLQAAAAL